MIITTTYTERLTITTADDGTITTKRTSHADTRTEYLFEDLSEAAQARAISDAIEEEQADFEAYGIYGASQTGFSISEIWQAAHELEKQQPVIFDSENETIYATPISRYWSEYDKRYLSLYGDSWELVSEAEDNGICFSVDLCNAWNTYAPRIIALREAYDEATDRAAIHEENADTAEANGNTKIARAERKRSDIYSYFAGRIEETANELTNEAAQTVADTMNKLIETTCTYYASAEFWREWLNDGDERYTHDGERI